MRALFFFLLAGFLWIGAAATHAQAAATAFTLDLPYDGHTQLPAWLGHPAAPEGVFASLSLPVTPPDSSSAMLVTVFFEEKNSGFLRIGWQGLGTAPEASPGLPGPGEAAQSVVLSNNFYEGIAMKNQRSLLVPADIMKKAGGLVFTTGDATLGISRIRIEWLQNAVALSSPAVTDQPVILSDRKTKFASDLAGLPVLARDAAWHDQVVDVPLTDAPTRIEQGIDFPVQMEKLPKRARLDLKEAGLPFGQHLVVWLNDQRVATLTPSAPDLSDAGYPADTGDTYIGWQDGSLLVPVGKLTAGDNVFQFSSEPDDAPTSASGAPKVVVPLALKDVTLQLDYPPAPVAAAPPTDMDRLTPATAPGALLQLPDPSTAFISTPTTP